MTKVTPENMKELYDTLWNIFCRKNHDYGNSFELSLDKHGLVAGIVRMEDKMNRLSTLTQGDKDAQIASESLVDTLMDLSNYAAMSACWLMGQDEKTRDEEPTESGQFTGLKVLGYDTGEGLSGSINTTISNEEFEEVEKTFHLASFKGHQEKVNERAHYEKDGVSDEEIINNWGLVGDSKTVRSRTTGYYLVEDDNPELFRKIYGLLLKHKNLSATWKPAPEDITNFVENTNNKFESQLESLSKLVDEEKARRDNIEADMEHDTEVICRAVRDSKDKPLLTDPKGLGNEYFIRQHTNPEDSSRYTLAFNPEGTVKTQLGDDLPYVIECFGNNYVGMTRWAIHVFNTRQDMVAALNYDLKVRDRYSSKNFGDSMECVQLIHYFGDSIGELNITKDVFKPENTTPVFAAWMDNFGEPFIKNMTSRDIFIDGYFGVKQGVKTFSTVFISEKTGALVVKGLIREGYSDRNHHFVWFSDTKEVLLEIQNAVPKFNNHGIFYDVDSEHLKTGENIHFNPLYNNMEDKILSKFHAWDGSELKNLVFFNEDEPLNNEIREKKMQIPGDLSEKKSGDTDGSEDFDRSFGHI